MRRLNLDRNSPAVVLVLTQVPPGVSFVRDVVSPSQMALTPRMSPGSGCTVTTVLVRQPVGRVYVIDDVPCDTSGTEPEFIATVAADVLPLIHSPPVEVEAKTVD